MFYINFSCKCAWSEKCLIVRISKSTSVNHLIFSHTNKRKLFTCNLMIFLARWKPRIQIIFIPIWENTTIFPLKHSPLIWIRLFFPFHESINFPAFEMILWWYLHSFRGFYFSDSETVRVLSTTSVLHFFNSL